jgi:hypothetical protein
MALLTEYADLDEQAGGLFHQAIYLKPIAYWRAGSLVRLVNRLGRTNDPAFPVGVDERVQFRLRERLDAQLPFCLIAAGQSWVRMTALGVQPVAGRAVGENGCGVDPLSLFGGFQQDEQRHTQGVREP